jgi:mRNA interferase RelE/StbE
VTDRLRIARSAARAIAEDLPESVGAAVVEFATGPLLDDPQRVGKALRSPLDGRHSARRGQYRVIYEIDDKQGIVTVLVVSHRRDAYS